MNIVITLPQDLWLKIVSGEKSYEMRKWHLPWRFNRDSDVIYVAINGQPYIAGYFKVENQKVAYHRDNGWSHFGKLLGITKEQYDNYWGHYDLREYAMWFWGISHVVVFSPNNRPFSLHPNKFVYTDLNIR